MFENKTLTITVANEEENESFFQDLKSEYPDAYRINVDSFMAQAFVQIIIPLVGVIAGSSVLVKLIEKIFEKDVISIEVLGVKYSGNIENLPKVIEHVRKQEQSQNGTKNGEASGQL